jgi:spermidine/putrescine transport system ATP-binding protein
LIATPQVTGREQAGQTASDVRLDGVTKRFDDVVAVDGISLEIPSGSFFALLGPSGCGKTTTLRMIGGFEEPDDGAIFLADKPVTGLPPYKRDVNTVFQSYALFPHLSIFENVAFGLRRRRVDRGQVAGRVREILRLVDLAGVESRKPRQLSGGQQQRVALARALVNNPQVLLLDEPLGALDLKLRKQMQLELKRIQSEMGITFIHVTHDQEEAMTMADAIAVMSRGRIEQLGRPEELYERPHTSFVARFLGASNLLPGTVEDSGTVRLRSGVAVRVADSLPPQGSSVAVGIRPEKLRLEGSDANRLSGTVKEVSYVGVATQYVVDTSDGILTVYVQNSEPGTRSVAAGTPVELSFGPDSAFVVEHTEEDATP